MRAMITLSKFKEYVDMIMPITDEANLCFTEKGLQVTSTDIARVSMLNIVLKENAFLLYPETVGNFNVNLQKIQNSLKFGKPADTVILTFVDGSVKINIGTSLSLKYNLLGEINGDIPKIPFLKHATSFRMDPYELQKITRAADDVGHTLRFDTTDEGVAISSEQDGDEVDMQVILDPADIEETKYTSSFSLEYLNKIVKVLPRATDIMISLSNEYPLKLTVDSADIFAEYVLAPQIQA